MDDRDLFDAPLDTLIADLIAERNELGFVYRCPNCLRILVSQERLSRADCCENETLEYRYGIKSGTLIHDYSAAELHRRLIQALAERQELALAILYGSRARGDNRPLSDFDVMVEFRGDPEPYRRLWRLISDLRDAVGVRIDVGLLESLQNDPLAFREILTDGQVLVDRDDRWAALQAERPAVEQAATDQWEATKELLHRQLKELGGKATE